MKKIILLLFLLVSFIACIKKENAIFAERKSISECVYASGIIKARNQYQIFSKNSGIIKKIHVKEGEQFKKGQILFSIENELNAINEESASINAAYNSRNANLSKIEELNLNIETAKKKYLLDSSNFEKQRRLWQQNIGSKIELDNRELVFQNAKAQYLSLILKRKELEKSIDFASKQSAKNLELIKTQFKNDQILSVIDGKLYQILKEEGEMITPNTPIAIAGKADEFLLELLIDEYDIMKIKLGQPVFIEMDSYKNEIFEAEISNIIPIMNEKNKTFSIEAVFTKVPKQLYPNLSAEANILIKTKENALIIPIEYLDDKQNITLENGEKRKVKIGIGDYTRVEIISGISENDAIVKPKP
jgi:RND family efflux transporter MFP subunit